MITKRLNLKSTIKTAVWAVTSLVCLTFNGCVLKEPSNLSRTRSALLESALPSWNANHSALLVFWAPWCPMCLEELPTIRAVVPDLIARKVDVVMISVGRDANHSVFLSQRGLSDVISITDRFDRITKAFRITDIPAMILVDKFGGILYRAPNSPQEQREFLESGKLFELIEG